VSVVLKFVYLYVETMTDRMREGCVTSVDLSMIFWFLSPF
jgi:hypothetical protein